MMTNKPINLILVLCFAYSLFSCKTNLLILEDLVPRAQQQDFEVSFSQSSLNDFSLNLELSYKIWNPYKKALPVPDHSMGILLNDNNTDLLVEHESVTISPESSKILHYKFHLDHHTLASIMGKNNKITFLSSIELDLTDYSDMLPNYQLSVTEDFDIETSEFKPMLDKLLKKQIGTYEFNLEHSTHIKIPAPPTIGPSSSPIEITLLGDGLDLINPNEIKNALLPFGDLLVHGKLNGLKDPFLDAVLDASVPNPIPPFDPTEIPLEDEILKLINGFFPAMNASVKWEGLKDILYQEVEIDATDYFVNNFLDEYTDTLAAEKWEFFKSAYDSLKDTQFPDQIPGPQTRGFELAIPISFRNNNDFSISIPLFASGIIVNDNQPFTIYVRTKNSNEISLNTLPNNMAEIPANFTETLYVVFAFDMNAFNQGMYSLFMRNQFEPNLQGIVSYDFGYGPLYVGYDLEDISLEYENSND